MSSEDGNTNDSTTHLATWEALCRVSGDVGFLYVADSKLCSQDALASIAEKGGRFVTVLPRSRREDAQFRQWVQEFVPQLEKVRDRPNLLAFSVLAAVLILAVWQLSHLNEGSQQRLERSQELHAFLAEHAAILGPALLAACVFLYFRNRRACRWLEYRPSPFQRAKA